MATSFKDHRLLGHLPGSGDPRVWLLGASECPKLAYKEELDQADKWWDPARPRLLRWKNDWYRSCPSLVLLRWRSPPPFIQEWWDHIQYMVLGYPVVCHWGEQGCIQICLGHNWWPMVPGVQDPDSSPWAFRRAGGQGRSFIGRQIRYSYVITGIAAWFDGEAMGLEPPWLWLRIPWWYPPCNPRGCG
jgi:hypothetical protein